MRIRVALALAAVAATLAACKKSESYSQDTVRPAETTAAAPAPAQPALDDPTIVAIFDNANTADIETGQLAQRKGSTKAVRDFGAQLVHDHTAVRQQGRDLAKSLNVTPTPPANDQSGAEHAAAMDSLKALSGTAFDRAFLNHEVGFHQAVIDAVNNTLMPAIKNDSLKALVTRVAPAFAAHRDKAKSLLEQMH